MYYNMYNYYRPFFYPLQKTFEDNLNSKVFVSINSGLAFGAITYLNQFTLDS